MIREIVAVTIRARRHLVGDALGVAGLLLGMLAMQYLWGF